jgi:hypothetical protein
MIFWPYCDDGRTDTGWRISWHLSFGKGSRNRRCKPLLLKIAAELRHSLKISPHTLLVDTHFRERVEHFKVIFRESNF